MPLITAVIAIVAAVLITALIVWNAAISYRKKVVESKIGSAEEKAREIIDEAMKTAEAKKREGLLEVKEEALKNKNELEKETNCRSMKNVYFPRKKLWIARRIPLNAEKINWHHARTD